MSDKTSIVVVSDDHLFVEEVRLNSPLKGQTLHVELNSSQTGAQDLVALVSSALGKEQAPVVIIDIDQIPADQHAAMVRTVKSRWSRTALILTGASESLSTVLKSDVQALVYRAFSKPISVRQLALSLEPAETLFSKASTSTKTDKVAPPVTDSRKSVVFAGFGLAALSIGVWLFFSESSNEVTTASIPDGAIEQSSSPMEIATDTAEPSTDLDASTNDLDLLIDQGELAVREGRLLGPKNDNALFYFNSALKQDPYSNRAYSGRKELAATLLARYPELIDKGQYKQALAYVDAYKTIAPLDPSIEGHYATAEKLIESHFSKSRKADDADIAARAKLQFKSIEDRFGQNSAIAATLANEETVINEVRASIRAANLIPPKDANAYSLLSEAVAKNSISKANQEKLTQELEAKLDSEISNKLDNVSSQQELATVDGLIAHLKLVNAKAKSIKEYSELASTKQREFDAAQAKAEAKLAAKPKIAPAKLLSRKSVRYPQRALDRGVEGWVEVAFKVDTEGQPIDVVVKQSQPSDVFDDAALRAIKDWKFLPAMDMNTGKPISTDIMSTKMFFKLEDD